MAQNGSHSRSWELNYSDHWAKYVNSFWRIEILTFAKDFVRLFDTPFPKKFKKSCFFKSVKNVKYVFSNIAGKRVERTESPSTHHAALPLIAYKQLVTNFTSYIICGKRDSQITVTKHCGRCENYTVFLPQFPKNLTNLTFSLRRN